MYYILSITSSSISGKSSLSLSPSASSSPALSSKANNSSLPPLSSFSAFNLAKKSINENKYTCLWNFFH